MEERARPQVRTIAIRCAAQTAKTQTALNLLCHAIAEDPGHAMWVTSTRQEMIEFAKDRLNPTLSKCEPVRQVIKVQEVGRTVFGSMVLYTAWAGSKQRLQSKPVRYLFCDEVRNYPPGRLEMVLKRTTAYWNAKVLLLSTAGVDGDAIDRAFQEGDQRHWHFECPACHKLLPLKFGMIKWDTTDKTKPAGKWDFRELEPTIRLECDGCGHRITDNPLDRRRIAMDGRFVQANTLAPADVVSFTWPAMIAPWVSWSRVVREFLIATDAMRSGDIQPMFTFVTECLGESWVVDRWLDDDAEYLHKRKEDYDIGDTWPIETARFIAADRQAKGGEHYFWVCRAFGPGGASRLVGYGRCNTVQELDAVRDELKVPRERAMIDTGYKASEVYLFCLGAGWRAMKGDEVDHFVVHDKRRNRQVRQVWRVVNVDPYIGTGRNSRRILQLVQWSNPSIKDYLALFTHGVIGQWSIPRKTGADYIDQMSAEVRETVTSALGRQKTVWRRRSRDNHYLDCELMISTAAICTGFLRYSPLTIAAPDVAGTASESA